ncbi:Cof-type HAD-IIB family hydrolase [Alkalihalobacillus sp. 1P02AB]|uniref:Cof-type HAD-IIB family hydrolase n=1 Tax=Alkalihalobacillus sp. 1P02AB TaxID=3132260 RepID=UPI0039A4FBD8
MEKSVIFFDIDGTLLTEEKTLPASTKEAIMKLKELGHEVAIATGRAPFMYKKLREELGIDTYVSYNGQYVVLNGEVIYTNPLNREALEQLTNEALENGHPVVFMNHEEMKANVAEDHEYIQESIATLKVYQMPGHDPHFYKDRDIYQTLLFCQENEEVPYEQKYKDLDFVRWHPVSLDVIPQGGSKAVGIAKIMEKLGYPKERQYAFGDGLNDIEMLTEIENSVAMGNAEPEVKDCARYVTKSVDEDGIAHGLKMVGLL